MRCIVSHDAGGAELLASYVARQGGEWKFVLGGPARKIFARRLGVVKTSTLEGALVDCDEFITGSSWQSDLEWQAILRARQLGKPVSTFLDHWVNYRERFCRGGIECLPDVIWVGDKYALDQAKSIFPELAIQFVVNPYFQDIQEAATRYASEQHIQNTEPGLRVLFVCEPISEHAARVYGNPMHWGYTEFDALRFFNAEKEHLGDRITSLLIRPHPAEAPRKYDEILLELGPLASLGGVQPLIQEIMAADVVVGCASMAMVVGLLAGKRVCCAIPSQGQPCALPHREIEHLADKRRSE